jgi:hypothetical protein
MSSQVSACREVLIAKQVGGGSVVIADLLKLLPLNPTDPETLTDLINRGVLQFGGGMVTNTASELTRASFLDDNVGSVRVVVPEVIAARVTADKTEIEFEDDNSNILLILNDLPREYPFSGNFVIRKLTLNPLAVVCTVQDQVTPNGWFQIGVDLTLDPTPFAALAAVRSMPAHRRQRFAIALKLLADKPHWCWGTYP